MHDLDRTTAEWEPEFDTFGSEEFEYEEEAGLYDEAEMESLFDEDEEMELATNLLDVSNEAELEQFLGKMFKRVGRKVGRFMKSPTGRRLKKYLRGVAKRALPIAGRAIGERYGGAEGAKLGAQIGSTAGNVLGLELEGLSPEDQEFEVARRFVRLAGTAAENATLTPSTATPETAAKAAITKAARLHAPGLVSAISSGATPGQRSGRWVRRGRRIVLMGV
jgi:hypothetical protein